MPLFVAVAWVLLDDHLVVPPRVAPIHAQVHAGSKTDAVGDARSRMPFPVILPPVDTCVRDEVHFVVGIIHVTVDGRVGGWSKQLRRQDG